MILSCTNIIGILQVKILQENWIYQIYLQVRLSTYISVVINNNHPDKHSIIL